MQGGGYFLASNPNMKRITFERNSFSTLAFAGGSTGVFEDVFVDAASAGPLGSIGIFIREGSSPIFRRCTVRRGFLDGGDGGGVAMDDSNPVFEDCLFEENQGAAGGGVAVEGGSLPLFIRTTFRDNVATSTGGAVGVSLSAPVFINCTFERNTALGAGDVPNRV